MCMWIEYRPSRPQWFCVSLLSLSESDALCGLLWKRSGLFIKPAREEVRLRVWGRVRRATALDPWCKIEWDKYKHFLYQYRFIESNTSPGSWKCLSLLSLSPPSALVTAARVCSLFPSLLFAPLMFHLPHIFSHVRPSPAALSTKVMHNEWSDSPLRRILAGV